MSRVKQRRLEERTKSMSSDMLYKATTLRKAALVFASAMASICAMATPFTYVDHWPDGTSETETEVVVPDGTTAAISTADHVARVARLASISLGGSAAKVDYTASSALALSAAVSGAGVFSAVSAGNLTLSGNNSGLVERPTLLFAEEANMPNSFVGYILR